MIVFFIGIIQSICLDVISTILTIYERSLLSASQIRLNGTSKLGKDGYCITDIDSNRFKAKKITIKPSIRNRIIHIDFQYLRADIQSSVPVPSKYPEHICDLIKKTLYSLLKHRIIITGDHIQISYDGISSYSRNILYRKSVIGTHKTIFNYSDYRILARKLLSDLSYFRADLAVVHMTRNNKSSGKLSIPPSPFPINIKEARIIYLYKPHCIYIRTHDVSYHNAIKIHSIQGFINEYSLLSINELEFICESHVLHIDSIQTELCQKRATLINDILRTIYPPIPKQIHKRIRPTEQLTINSDFLSSLCSESEEYNNSSVSESTMETQIQLINEYIDTNAYISYIPIVDKSAKNSELAINKIVVRWPGADWYICKLRAIDQSENTYFEVDDISVHHPGIFHISRHTQSERKFIIRIKKLLNQLTISPFPIYMNSDLSRVVFPEIQIIRKLLSSIQTEGSTMYGYVSIDGFHMMINIHTEIHIGHIDINDADLDLSEWHIWCPANWSEVASKYEIHIKEQIYKDSNITALLGKSPLSPISYIMSLVNQIRSLHK